MVRAGSGGAGPAGVRSGPARVVSPRLVGRAAELSLLAAALSAPPAVAVVRGEAGIGKTRLVSELPDHPALAGRRFVTGWCRQIREPFPLGPVIEAVRALGGVLAAESLPPVTGALRPLLPEIADRLPPAPEPLDDRSAQRHRVFRGLVAVLGSLGPTVLILEDLHWADEQTVDFVSYLLGEPPPALSLVVTFRDEGAGSELRALAARLPPPVSRAQVNLTLLAEPETGALAAAILGLDRVPAEFARLLQERTSGLPFAVEELMASLPERAAQAPGAGGWVRGALAELAVPQGVRDSMLARLSRLSVPGRSVVRAAAVWQSPVPVSLLAGVCQLDRDPLARAVAEAMEAGLLVEDGATVGFRHLLAAQAVYEDMPGVLRQSLHDRAASALAELAAVPLGQLAHHLRHAGQQPAWVDAAERAADQAVAVGHDDEAARLLEEVLHHAPLDPEREGRIAVKLGRAAQDTVHVPGRVTDLLGRVLQRDLPAAVRGELRFRLAMLIGHTGGGHSGGGHTGGGHTGGGHTGAEPRGGRHLLAEAIPDLDGDPALKAWAIAAMGVRAIAELPPLDPRPWLDRAMRIISRVDDPILERFLLGKVAATLVITGDPQWRRLVARLEEQTGGSPRRRQEVHAYYMAGTTACLAGHHTIAGRLLAGGLAGVSACENQRLELLLQSATAVLNYLRGSWQGLREAVECLIDDVDDYPPARIDAELVAGGLALAYGDFDHAHRRLSDALARAEKLADFLFLPLGFRAAIDLALARGDVDCALAHARSVLAAVPDQGIWAPFARVLPALTRALVAAERLDEAGAVLDRWAGQLASQEAPLAAAAVSHARGYVELAGGRWLPAAEWFQAAADQYDAQRCPYDAAQAREQVARCLFEAGEPATGTASPDAPTRAARAEAALRAAMAGYQRLGATWDLDRARGVARQHGVPAPNRHRGGRRGYGDHLSPREWEVAELAALGRTNKEIAAELFLSPHTVDKHLRSALRKLGVRSRTMLARRLSGARSGQSPPPTGTAANNGGSSP